MVVVVAEDYMALIDDVPLIINSQHSVPMVSVLRVATTKTEFAEFNSAPLARPM